MSIRSTVDDNKWLIGGILLVAVFLVGFLPQFLEARRVRSELQDSAERIASLELDLRMAELRDLSGLMLLEALRQNYGLAGDQASAYFERLQDLVTDNPDLATISDLRGLLGRRDSITAIIAQNDPATLTEIQELYLRTHEVTRRR